MDRLLYIIRSLFELLPHSARRQLFWLVPLMILAAVLEMVGLALVMPLIQAVTNTQSFTGLPLVEHITRKFGAFTGPDVLIAMGVAVAVFYVIKNAILFATVYAENRFIMTAVSDAATNLLSTYLAAPYVFHLRHNSAELIRNLNSSVDGTFRGMMRPVVRIVSEGLVIGGIFTVLMLADPIVTIVMGGFLGLVMGGLFLSTQQHVARWGRNLQHLYKNNLQALNETLGSIKEVRILGRQVFFVARFAEIRRKMSHAYVLHQSVSELPRLVNETLLVFAFVLALTLVLVRGDEGGQVLSLLALYAFAGFRLMPSFNRIIQFANSIRFASASLKNVLAHREELGHVAARPATLAMDQRQPFDHDILLEKIAFTHENAKAPAIDGVTLRIVRGQSVGLIGTSGAGKTTLVDILLGLLEPQRGRVLVDGAPIAGREVHWQRNIGYIPQQIYLLDDTLRRNVALGVEDDEVDNTRLREALALAHLDKMVEQLPDGLRTLLGENGVRLSGGQRQRIGIARALYHRPALLVMDEATSSLDNETEHDISAAINAIAGERTLVIVAHRLSTIRRCNTIVLLRNGQVADQGTYDELYERSPEFRNLAKLGATSQDDRQVNDASNDPLVPAINF